MPNDMMSYVSQPNEQRLFYERVLLDRAIPSFVFIYHAQKARRQVLIPRNNGDTIQWRKFGALANATTPLAEGITPPPVTTAVTKVEAQVKQYGSYMIFTDLVDVLSIDPSLTEYSELLGEQAGATLDYLASSVIMGGSNVQFASTATQRTEVSAAMKLTTLEILEAVAALETANVPRFPNGLYVGIVHPRVKVDMLTDTVLVALFEHEAASGRIKDNPLVNYSIGQALGVDWYVSSNASFWQDGGVGSPAADVYGTVIFGPGAFGVGGLAGMTPKDLNAEHETGNTEKTVMPIQLIVKQLGSGGPDDALDQRGSIGWKTTFVAVRLDETRMIRIEHGASITT